MMNTRLIILIYICGDSRYLNPRCNNIHLGQLFSLYVILFFFIRMNNITYKG